MAIVLGLNAKAYIKDPLAAARLAWPATGSAPDLNELTNVTDVTVNLSKSEADITTRTSGGYRATVGTLKEGEISFDMLWDTADPRFQEVFDAWDNSTSLSCAFLDGDSATADTQGLWADFAVITFEKQEPLEEAQRVSVTLKITIVSGNPAPEWITVAV